MKIYTLLDGDNVFHGSYDTKEKAKQAIIDLQLETINVWTVPSDFVYSEALLCSQNEDNEVYELLMKRYLEYLRKQEPEHFDFCIVESELNELFNPED